MLGIKLSLHFFGRVRRRPLLVTLTAGGLISLGAGGAAPAFAASPVDLAKAKNCMACHSIDRKIVGPAFKDVASKYAGEKSAEALLVRKVLNGGSGVWGSAPMPPNRQVSETEARTLVDWVLIQR
jgi:cytochrome c